MVLAAGALLFVAALLVVTGKERDSQAASPVITRTPKERAILRQEMSRVNEEGVSELIVVTGGEDYAGGGAVADRKQAGGVVLANDASMVEDRVGGAVATRRATGVSKAISIEPKWQAVDPGASGNSMVLDGVRAEVTGYQKADQSPGVGLSLQLVDAEVEHTSEAKPVDQPAVDASTSPGEAPRWAGLTYEQELFRTKWGWHAFDQVQKALREDTSQ